MLIITAAVLWGCGTGVLISRPAYRFSVPPEEPWRSACPVGNPLSTGTGSGWLGCARCSDGDVYGPSTLSVASATAVICALLAAATGARHELDHEARRTVRLVEAGSAARGTPPVSPFRRGLL